MPNESLRQDGVEADANAGGNALSEAVQLGVTRENLATFLPFDITTTAYRRRDTRSTHE